MDVEKLIKNLQLRGFSVQHFGTAGEMVSYLSEEINGCEVGIGGSQTVKDSGLYEALKANNTIHWHWTDKDSDVLEKEIASEVFITGANAVSESGEIVNIDGRGNRHAGSFHGAFELNALLLALFLGDVFLVALFAFHVFVFGFATQAAVPSADQPRNCPEEPPLGMCLLPEVVGCV